MKTRIWNKSRQAISVLASAGISISLFQAVPPSADMEGNQTEIIPVSAEEDALTQSALFSTQAANSEEQSPATAAESIRPVLPFNNIGFGDLGAANGDFDGDGNYFSRSGL